MQFSNPASNRRQRRCTPADTCATGVSLNRNSHASRDIRGLQRAALAKCYVQRSVATGQKRSLPPPIVAHECFYICVRICLTFVDSVLSDVFPKKQRPLRLRLSFNKILSLKKTVRFSLPNKDKCIVCRDVLFVHKLILSRSPTRPNPSITFSPRCAHIFIVSWLTRGASLGVRQCCAGFDRAK